MSVYNPLTGAGDPAIDKAVSDRFIVTALDSPNDNTLLYAYETLPHVQTVASAYPNAALGRRVTVVDRLGPNQVPIPSLNVLMRRYDVANLVRVALIWSELLGGGGILFLANDGPLNTPLDFNRVTDIKDIVVLDKTQIVLSGFDSRIRVHYNARSWNVHPSRIILFKGKPLPEELMRKNLGFGGSIVRNVWTTITAIARYQQALLRAVEELTYNVHKIPDLRTSQLTRQYSDLLQRVQETNRTKSPLQGIVIDTQEDIVQMSHPSFAGLPGILEHSWFALAVATGIPQSILLGQGAPSLGQGDAPLQLWYQRVNAYTEAYAIRPMRRIIALLAKAYGVAPTHYEFSFRPFHEPTQAENDS